MVSPEPPDCPPWAESGVLESPPPPPQAASESAMTSARVSAINLFILTPLKLKIYYAQPVVLSASITACKPSVKRTHITDFSLDFW